MKTLRDIIIRTMIVGSLLIPNFTKAQEKINPFVQPNATTIYRGSGDVNSDGVINSNDYTAMQNDSLTCIQADIDIDGIPSTQNDLELLRQNIEEGKTLPTYWNDLSTEAQRLDLDRKTALVNKLKNIQVPSPWENNECVYLSLQEIINEAGYFGKPFPSNFNSTKNGEANLPTYFVSVFYPDNTGHAITGKAIGDSLNGDPRIWENWCFRDPQFPEKEVKIGDWSLKNIDSTEIRIEKITNILDNGYWSDKFIKFLIQDSVATCTYVADNVVLEREPSTPVPIEIYSFTAKNLENKINLEWITLSETNNYGFYVERSMNGKDFINIGFVNGKKTTSEENKYVFTDFNSGDCWYRLKQTDFDGSFVYSNILKAIISMSQKFVLENFPNPFNEETTIKYSILEQGEVEIDIYNIAGQKVKDLIEEFKTSGEYEIKWDGTNNSGQKVASGVYPYVFRKDGMFKGSKKMVLLK